MALGPVSGGTIKDPLTGTMFNLKTGEIVGDWCPNFPFSFLFSLIEPAGLPVFKCKTQGNSVSVEVDINAKTNFEHVAVSTSALFFFLSCAHVLTKPLRRSGYWKGILDAQGKADGGYY